MIVNILYYCDLINMLFFEQYDSMNYVKVQKCYGCTFRNVQSLAECSGFVNSLQ